MTEYEQMRKDLARQFRASGGGYKPEPMLDENGKEYMANWYNKNKHHYQAGGKYSDRKAA